MLLLHLGFMLGGDAATVDHGNYGQTQAGRSCGQSVNQ